nr:immunoglobulin heavy chain junction region [Mus musculus]MBK4186642.1 immunoglobulin heavy chain junction region [Mus musculus]MBK4186647.1 immunoglobulin heavy chain junction region [Mus musculus]MBK4195253.1 immunoglobulin heavy chain junction region [Mus musculus]
CANYYGSSLYWYFDVW